MSEERLKPRHDPILPRLDPEEAAYLSDELSHLRDLVTRGDHLAIAGGGVMAWWGVVLAIFHILLGLLAAQVLPGDLPLDWGLIIFGLGGSFLIVQFSKRRHFFRSWRTQAISTTWVFAGIAVLVFLLGSRWTHISEPHISMAFLAIVFSLVLAVTATSSRQSWLLGVAGGWMLTACAMFVIDNEIYRYTIMAAAMLVFMTLPGVALLRAEWRAHPKERTA